MTDQPSATERYLMAACGLASDDQLTRLGCFLVAHTVMDTRLISLLVDHEVGRLGGVGVLSLDRLQAITDDIARQTFKVHLNSARPGISERAAQIAEEINRGRDAFVHWKRGRFELPRYEGKVVTDEDGFRSCMAAVQEFLFAVPFHQPAWTANP